MAADNLKTAFRQPGKVNEDLQEFIMAAPTATAASKKYQPTATKYQPIQIRRCFEIYTVKGHC